MPVPANLVDMTIQVIKRMIANSKGFRLRTSGLQFLKHKLPWNGGILKYFCESQRLKFNLKIL